MYSTNVSEEEIREGVEDAYGILYSKDGEKLLSIKDNDNINNPYTVKDGTEVIFDEAFYDTKIPSVVIPESVKAI